jgi:hypothetical protein
MPRSIGSYTTWISRFRYDPQETYSSEGAHGRHGKTSGRSLALTLEDLRVLFK